MASTPPTIHDVAARAGVSRSTVSRILNNPQAGPSATRRAVEEAARALGYRPSSAARSLRSGRSNLIAFVVGDIRQPYFSSLARALDHEARDSGRSVLLFDVDRSLERLKDTLDQARSLPLAGIVVALGRDIDTPEIRESLEGLLATGLRVVTITQHLSYLPIPSVTVAHDETTYRAVHDLLSLGRSRIALVAGSADAPHVGPAVAGYLDALPADLREFARAELIVDGAFDADSTHAAVTRLLALPEPPDAFVTTSTFATLGVLNALEDAGLRAATDVVCTEDTEVLRSLRPAVSAYGVDYGEYARSILTTLDAGADQTAGVVLKAQPI